jgi:hypothetical protein
MNMKKNFKWLLVSSLFCFASLQAQNNTKDVVYLKNGSILKGSIMEMVPVGSIKIQTADGNIFVYAMTEVEKIDKEILPGQQSANPSSKNSPGLGQEATKSLVIQSDSTRRLEAEHGFFDLTYKYGGQKITRKEFKRILQSSKDSTVLSNYARATTLSIFSDISGGVSGFCLGYGITSKPTNLALVIAGAGLFVTALVLDTNADKAMQESLSRFNSSSISCSVISKNDFLNISSIQFEIHVRI